jgi:Tfp pilus assembly protein PilN
MKLRLNLSTAPRANNRPFLAAAGAIGAVAAIAFVILFHAAYADWRASRALRTDISRLESEIRADQATRQSLDTFFHSPDQKQILDRSNFLNSLIGERSFPWTKIFMDLEQTLPPGVRIINIAPRLDNGRAQVTLKVGAMDEQSKLKFLEAIEKSKVFSGMELKTDQASEQGAMSPDRITLDLTVWYQIS